jgi:hypothetical protein
VLLLCLTFSKNVSAQNIAIVTIYQSSIAARVVAERCNVLDTTLDQIFLGNLTSVAIRATQFLKQHNPSQTDQQLVSVMNSIAERLSLNAGGTWVG